MKVTLSLISICGSLLLLASCSSSPTQTENTQQGEVTKQGEATKSEQTNEVMEQLSIRGQVQEVEQGKDGYRAKIETTRGQVYWATISQANLKENASQYRAVQVGETITVKGDSWEMEGQRQITVRELK